MTAAVSVLDLLDIHESEVCLMHQGGGLERLARRLLGHLLRRQLPQLVVNEGQKLLGGLRVALVDGGQDARDFTHRLSSADGILTQANTKRGPLRTRDVRRFRRKVQGKRKAPVMENPIILVIDQYKGKQAITAKVLTFEAKSAENVHVDYHDAIAVQ
jgi:hypothetical protein